jgi:hypothetical protein
MDASLGPGIVIVGLGLAAVNALEGTRSKKIVSLESLQSRVPTGTGRAAFFLATCPDPSRSAERWKEGS